jgi:hypothetical protein
MDTTSNYFDNVASKQMNDRRIINLFSSSFIVSFYLCSFLLIGRFINFFICKSPIDSADLKKQLADLRNRDKNDTSMSNLNRRFTNKEIISTHKLRFTDC